MQKYQRRSIQPSQKTFFLRRHISFATEICRRKKGLIQTAPFFLLFATVYIIPSQKVQNKNPSSFRWLPRDAPPQIPNFTPKFPNRPTRKTSVVRRRRLRRQEWCSGDDSLSLCVCSLSLSLSRSLYIYIYIYIQMNVYIYKSVYICNVYKSI